MSWAIIKSDARRIPLRDESVQCVVTSPPYFGLRDYGIKPMIWGGELSCAHEWSTSTHYNGGEHPGEKQRWQHTGAGKSGHPKIKSGFCSLCRAWLGCLGLEPTPELFVQHIVEVFREVWRVLRKDGTIWVNLGDSYNAHPGQRTEHDKAGWKQVSNRGSCETASRSTGNLKAKDMVGVPWRVAFALQADGWYLRSDIIYSKLNPMPESTKDRPTKSHEYIFLLSKSARYFFDQDAVREPITCDRLRGSGPMTNPLNGDRNDSDQRGDYRLRTKKPDGWATHTGGHGSIHKNGREKGEKATIDLSNGRNIRSVWTMATQPYPEAHFATFPEELPERCIKAGSKPGDIVLDPFAGAGTTPLVADKLGRIGIGLELKWDYVTMSKRRLTESAPLLAFANL